MGLQSVAALTLMVGVGTIFVGMLRTFTRRQEPEFRKAVSLTLVGSGIGVFAVAILIISVAPGDALSIALGIVVALIGVSQLALARLVRRPR